MAHLTEENTNNKSTQRGRRSIAARPAAVRAITVGVDIVGASPILTVGDSLAELKQLAGSVEIDVIGEFHQKMRSPHPATFVGKGKAEEIGAAVEEQRADVVIFDDELSPGQQRTLEEMLKVPVIDRSQVILDVFANRARTREGRLQVQLAAYEYQMPRLTGAWTHLSRQFGRGATRGGPGETQLELDRRQIRHRIADLKRQIEKVRQQRQVHRDFRRERGMSIVALVGYTNAGKSTLFNALVHAELPAKDRPFDTLDPTTRRCRLPSGQTVLISDTVGFIQKLPLTLVAAFRATLEELEVADILIHVLDVSHKRGFEQGVSVQRTLAELKLADKPTITALNKVDRLVGVTSLADLETGVVGDEVGQLAEHYPSAVPVSAAKGWNLDRLVTEIERMVMPATL